MKSHILATCLILIALTACSQSPASPPTATATVIPTHTPAPPATLKPTDPPAPPADVSAPLKAAMQRYDQLVLAMDANNIAQMYTPQGELVDAGAVLAKGPAAIRSYLASFDGVVRVQENMSTVKAVVVEGALAKMSGTFTQKALLLSTNKVVQSGGRFEAVWSKQPNGEWLIQRMSTF